MNNSWKGSRKFSTVVLLAVFAASSANAITNPISSPRDNRDAVESNSDGFDAKNLQTVKSKGGRDEEPRAESRPAPRQEAPRAESRPAPREEAPRQAPPAARIEPRRDDQQQQQRADQQRRDADQQRQRDADQQRQRAAADQQRAAADQQRQRDADQRNRDAAKQRDEQKPIAMDRGGNSGKSPLILNNNGTLDKRFKVNKDYIAQHPLAPLSQGQQEKQKAAFGERAGAASPRPPGVDGNGRMHITQAGRPDQRFGTHAVGSASRNQDIFVRRNTYVRQNQTVVIQHNVTYVRNVYNYNNIVINAGIPTYGYYRNYSLGSFEFAAALAGELVFGGPRVGEICGIYGCSFYTESYWSPLAQYGYVPAYRYAYAPYALSEDDLAVGLISWMFVDPYAREQELAAIAYNEQRMLLNQEQMDFYNASLGFVPTRGFLYAQAYLPTVPLVTVATDLSGADQATVQNFMDGLTDITSRLETSLRDSTHNPYFRLHKHDIDVRIAENHGNLLVLLKGHIDRPMVNGNGYEARAEFTATIDLTTGETKLFSPQGAMNMYESTIQATQEELDKLAEINYQVQLVDSSLLPE